MLADERVQHINDLCDADSRRLADQLLKGYPKLLQHLLPQCLPRCMAPILQFINVILNAGKTAASMMSGEARVLHGEQ